MESGMFFTTTAINLISKNLSLNVWDMRHYLLKPEWVVQGNTFVRCRQVDSCESKQASELWRRNFVINKSNDIEREMYLNVHCKTVNVKRIWENHTPMGFGIGYRRFEEPVVPLFSRVSEVRERTARRHSVVSENIPIVRCSRCLFL
jgi:hypothetical protein